MKTERYCARLIGSLVFLGVTVFAVTPNLYAEPIESIKIIKISPEEQRVVVEGTDGKRKVIGIGDELGNNGAVTEISEERIVVEEKSREGTGVVIIRIEETGNVIDEAAKSAQIPTTIERIFKRPPTGNIRYKTRTVEVRE